jgi:DNA polymerase I-like protein with 3'-5' exonuclease and polymerase domains
MGLILTKEELDEMVAYYLTQDAFAYDVETMGDRRGDTPVNDVVWISFATYGRVDVIPMGHPNGEFIGLDRPLTGQGQKRVDAGHAPRESDYSRSDKRATKLFSPAPEQLFPAEVFKALEPLMFNDKILKVGHNLAFDLTSVAKYLGKRVPVGPYFDTMIASFLYNTQNKGKCGLADCLKREIGYEMVKGVGKEIEAHSFLETYKYAALDAKYTFLLWKALIPKLEESGVEKVMNLEMDVLAVLCDMKLTGAPIDMDSLTKLQITLEAELEIKRASIYKQAGRQFNINSIPERQELLYKPKIEGGRGLKTKVLTTKGQEKSDEGKELLYTDYSTSSEALAENKEKDELCKLLVEYADLNKLLTTYVIPYLGGDVTKTTGGKSKTEYRDSLLINGRIHCDFVQNGAETGRFSSRNPNLQNVPSPATAHGKAIRNLFIPPVGQKLVVADYSQIEPRIIADFSHDPIMVKSYLDKEDIYMTVAATMGVNRAAGKTLVLSMAYGVGPDKIARSIGCTNTEAKKLLNDFAEKFSAVGLYKLRVIGVARKRKYVVTATGRRRYLPDIVSSNREKKAGAERQAFNTVIQGTAADIMKIAMVRAHKMIPEGAKILLTVHDELVTSCPEHLAEQTAEAIREAMEGVKMLKTIPLIADVKIVDKWGMAK